MAPERREATGVSLALPLAVVADMKGDDSQRVERVEGNGK